MNFISLSCVTSVIKKNMYLWSKIQLHITNWFLITATNRYSYKSQCEAMPMAKLEDCWTVQVIKFKWKVHWWLIYERNFEKNFRIPLFWLDTRFFLESNLCSESVCVRNFVQGMLHKWIKWTVYVNAVMFQFKYSISIYERISFSSTEQINSNLLQNLF